VRRGAGLTTAVIAALTALTAAPRQLAAQPRRGDSAAAPSAAVGLAVPGAAATGAATAPSAVASDGTAADPRRAAKKDRDLADKRARAALGPLAPVTRVGVKPTPLINLMHRWTQETLAVPALGAAPPLPLQRRLLRDHYTNETTEIAGRLVPTLVAAATAFRVSRVEIVSAYRHPKYNLILRKKGHQVARDSEHSHGQAVDFRLPGVTTERLASWALGRRMGGVGTYLQSRFVHMDVGPIRRWSGE
jgi:Bacterial protein of unknown function (DUF882)